MDSQLQMSVVADPLDIVLITGHFQTEFHHRVPETKVDVGPRIDFSFRKITRHHFKCDCF